MAVRTNALDFMHNNNKHSGLFIFKIMEIDLKLEWIIQNNSLTSAFMCCVVPTFNRCLYCLIWIFLGLTKINQLIKYIGNYLVSLIVIMIIKIINSICNLNEFVCCCSTHQMRFFCITISFMICLFVLLIFYTFLLLKLLNIYVNVWILKYYFLKNTYSFKSILNLINLIKLIFNTRIRFEKSNW